MNKSFYFPTHLHLYREINILYIRHTLYITSYLTKYKSVNKYIKINIQSIPRAPNRIMLIRWRILREPYLDKIFTAKYPLIFFFSIDFDVYNKYI